MKKIILVVGNDEEAAQRKTLELIAHDTAQDFRVRTQTPTELQMALAAGHTPVIRTLRAILPVREEKLRRLYPDIAVEVVDIDEEARS